MPAGYAGLAKRPRPIPWPFRVFEAALAAGAVGVLLDVFPLAPTGTVIAVALLLLAMLVVDVSLRSRYAGTGLERSFTQLAIGAFTLLISVVVLLAIGPGPPLWVGLLGMLGLGGLVYAALHVDQRMQIRRAQALAERRDAKRR